MELIAGGNEKGNQLNQLFGLMESMLMMIINRFILLIKKSSYC